MKFYQAGSDLCMMKKVLTVRKMLLYKLNFNKLNDIKCKCPINVEMINIENAYKVLNFRDANIESCFKNMFNNKEIGIYGILNNQAVAHAWCMVNNDKAMKKFPPFYKTKSEIAYIHFCNVKEDLRGNNIYPYLLYNLIKIVNENYNIDTFYIDTDDYNVSSQNGIKKLGFELCHKYKFISILDNTINKRILE